MLAFSRQSPAAVPPCPQKRPRRYLRKAYPTPGRLKTRQITASAGRLTYASVPRQRRTGPAREAPAFSQRESLGTTARPGFVHFEAARPKPLREQGAMPAYDRRSRQAAVEYLPKPVPGERARRTAPRSPPVHSSRLRAATCGPRNVWSSTSDRFALFPAPFGRTRLAAIPP